MALETVDQFHAAMMQEASIQTTVLVEIRDEQRAQTALLRNILDAVGSLWVRDQGGANGHASQLEIGSMTNGSGAAPRQPKRCDEWGNYPVRGVALEFRNGEPVAWNASYTPRPGTPALRLHVRLEDWGPDAFRFAVIALAIYRGQDVADNLERLPSELRRKVNKKIYTERKTRPESR